MKNNAPDNVMTIILIKYVKFILKMIKAELTFQLEEENKPNFVFLVLKLSFFNKITFLDYSLDFIKSLLDHIFFSEIKVNNSIFLLFEKYFHPDVLTTLIESASNNNNNNDLNILSELLYHDFNRPSNVGNLYSRDTCIFYFAFLFNQRKFSVNQAGESSRIKFFFPPLFYSNFNLIDIPHFLTLNGSMIIKKEGLSSSASNLILTMASKILKFNLPLDNFELKRRINDHFEESLPNPTKYPESFLDSPYIEQSKIKDILFQFLVE
jgi:hypothetical protein